MIIILQVFLIRLYALIPILKDHRAFTFTYEIKGFICQSINKIYLKTTSGYSSFVDFLIFFQVNEPSPIDTPLYAIEETKTSDSESRNTGVYQRASKFIYIDYYYRSIKKIMLYSSSSNDECELTQTNIFGTRCLLTLGIEFLGKEIDNNILKPFSSIDELIKFKQSMRKPPKNNVPIDIIHKRNKIIITGRLIKSNSLSHDPNIGALSLISASLRKLGFRGEIEISLHGLSQNHLHSTNKFIYIANLLNITLENLKLPQSMLSDSYWKYERIGEKLGTIFIHLVIEDFTNAVSIYENHAGCERGYFFTKNGDKLSVDKYTHSMDSTNLFSNNKTKIYIPDVVFEDVDRLKILNVEGKKYENMKQGIKELANFDAFENLYIKKYYPEYTDIIRTVVLYGSDNEQINCIEVSFLLNAKGKMILNVNAPELFHEAIENLLSYWK